MSTVPLTKFGAELLKQELHKLKTKERPDVINAIAEARAQGDLSENAEYDAAKERQAFIEGRIAELESKLSAAQVIDPTELDAEGRVVFAATVQLEDLESGQKVQYQIVGEDEADLKLSKVSITSPIARALIGKYAGDVVGVQAPAGVREYEILDVLYIWLGALLFLFFEQLDLIGKQMGRYSAPHFDVEQIIKCEIDLGFARFFYTGLTWFGAFDIATLSDAFIAFDQHFGNRWLFGAAGAGFDDSDFT